MKKFFVSKSDANRVVFIKDAIEKINPSGVYILCEKDRASVYSGIDAVIMPLKDLNKSANWIEFVNKSSKNSMLIIDNVLKCINYGDGKKEYLKNISQSINNIIVTDVVPFYTEPYEIFYPFYILGKGILGYNSYNTFQSNHKEEKNDGSVNMAHSFDVLKDKLKDYYVQDYDCFSNKREIIKWSISENENEIYLQKKQSLKANKVFNPINAMTIIADFVNLTETKAKIVEDLLKNLVGKTCLVLNTLGYTKSIRSKIDFLNFDVISYHEANLSKFSNYDNVIFYDNIIVKPHNAFYIEPFIKGKCICLIEEKTNIDLFLFNRIYNIELRNEFSNFFKKIK
jgi:hypothetical protein